MKQNELTSDLKKRLTGLLTFYGFSLSDEEEWLELEDEFGEIVSYHNEAFYKDKKCEVGIDIDSEVKNFSYLNIWMRELDDKDSAWYCFGFVTNISID